MNFALSSARFEKEAAGILHEIIEAERSEERMVHRDRGNLLKPFVKHFPRLTMDTIYTPDEDGKYTNAYRIVSDFFSNRPESAVAQVPTEILIDWCLVAPDTRFVFAALTGKLFEQTGDDNKELKLSDTAVEILENAPDKRAVLACYIDRFHPRSWSGSLADILEQRLPLLDELNSDRNSGLQKEIENAKIDLVRSIETERQRENDEERGRNSSFE